MNKRTIMSFCLAILLTLAPASVVFAQYDENIVELMAADENYSTVVAALQASALLEAMEEEGPFTIFVPTNDAFDELSDELLDELLADPLGDLNDVLRYHVVQGRVLAADITDGMEAETLLEGESVTFSVDGGTVRINNATIVATDIEAINGVIHVIDAVLLPGMQPDDEDMVDDEDAVTEDAVADDEITDTVGITPTTGVTPTTEITPTAQADVAAAQDVDDDDLPSVTVSDQESFGQQITIDAVVAGEAGWLVIHQDADGRPGEVIGFVAVPEGRTTNVTVILDEPIEEDTLLWAMLHVDAGEVGVYEFPGPDRPVTMEGMVVMSPFEVTVQETDVDPEDVPATEAVQTEAEAVLAEVDDDIEIDEGPDTQELEHQPGATPTPGVTPDDATPTPGVTPDDATPTPGVTPDDATPTPGVTPDVAAAAPDVTPGVTPGVTPTPGVAAVAPDAAKGAVPGQLPATGAGSSLPLVLGVFGLLLAALGGGSWIIRRRQ
jgi:LPXTG-motif cell wall-anchored protein